MIVCLEHITIGSTHCVSYDVLKKRKSKSSSTTWAIHIHTKSFPKRSKSIENKSVEHFSITSRSVKSKNVKRRTKETREEIHERQLNGNLESNSVQKVNSQLLLLKCATCVNHFLYFIIVFLLDGYFIKIFHSLKIVAVIFHTQLS